MEPLDAADRRLARRALLAGAAAVGGSALAAGGFPSGLLAAPALPSADAVPSTSEQHARSSARC